MSRLTEIADRAASATPGPWEASGSTVWRSTGDGTPTDFSGVAVAYVPPLADPQEGRPDADFIAHAREDVPYLLGEVARLIADVTKHEPLISDSVLLVCSCGWTGDGEDESYFDHIGANQ